MGTRLCKVGCKPMLKYGILHESRNDPEPEVSEKMARVCSMPPRPISQSLLSPFVQSVSLEGRQL